MSDRPVKAIVSPVTSDGLCGYDEFNQFMVYWYDPPGSDRLTGTMVADLRGETCVLCNQAWTVSSEDLRDQHWVDYAEAYVHKSCFIRHLGFLERAKWLGLVHKLVDTQRYDVKMKVLPNGYGGGWDTPWFRFFFHRIRKEGQQPERQDTIVQTVSMGARRHVDSIQFEKLTVDQAVHLEKTFQDVTDTKGIKHERHDVYSIHAYTLEQCERYVMAFLLMLGVARPPKSEDKATL